MTHSRRYRVALSYPGEERGLVAQVAERLAGALGRDQVFYDRFHEADLARPDLDIYLQQIYHDGSDLVVVFLSQDYESKEWCGIEWRAVRDLIKSRRSERIMLVRLDDAALPGLFPIDGTLDARGRRPKELANLILARLKSLDIGDIGSTPAHPVTRSGLLRQPLDRLFPRLHHFLTRHGTLPEPPELPHLDAYLRELKARLKNDIREKTYLPLEATVVPRRSTAEEGSQDPFERPIQQVIRQVLGRAQGGDSASAQIAAVNRRSRLVRNILKALLKTEDPLVLLGDPGSGKTMTLMEAALALAESEIGRVFPVVTVYIRLGEFHVAGEVGPEDVREFVKQCAPERLRPWIDELDAAGRLILLFDGMDEMSRDRYTEHTEALSLFAGALQGRTKTLFSCRITDFSPAFLHHRLVLLPFDIGQIAKYLHKYLSVPTLEIDAKRFSIRALARRLVSGDLPIDASNPFVLWLLCLYLEERKTWPESRVELIGYYSEKNYARKREDAHKEGILLPGREEAFRAWSLFAFTITERNLGSAIPVEALLDQPHAAGAAERTQLMIRTGKLCGVLAESADGQEHLVRFEHHRFQEYFTALHIHRVNPKIAWLDKLDAPRWQETLLKLVLLGGGEEAVSALVESITCQVRLHRPRFEEHEEEVRRRKAQAEAAKKQGTARGDDQKPDKEPEPPKIPGEEEALLADRVELGASLLRQAERSFPAVEQRLSPCLLEAVDFLVERGNPITQVKMMRACQRLKNVDLLKALEKPLRSPVHWVRNQALILVAATSAGVRTSRSNLATEMGFDLATNSLLLRWPTYLRALSSMGGARLWWSFLLATFLALANLALLLAEAGVFYLGALACVRHFSSKLPPWMGGFALPMLERPEAAVAFTLLVVGIAVLAMKSNPSFAWAWILGGAFWTVALGLAGLGLWQGEWLETIGGIFMCAVLLLIFLVSVIAIAGLVAQVSVLLAYLGLTRRARSAGHPAASFLSLMWTRSGFDVLEVMGPSALAILVVLPGMFALTLAFVWVAKRVSGLLGLRAGVTEAAFALLLGLLAWIVVARVRIKDLLSSARAVSRWLRLVSRSVWTAAKNLPLFFFAPWHLARWLASVATWVSLGRWLRAHSKEIAILVSVAVVVQLVFVLVHWLITSHGQQFGQGCVLLLLASYLVLMLFLFLRMLRYAITARWMYPPRSFTPESWKDLMKRTPPVRQEDILLRTHHQSLGVNAAEYLQVLKEVEPLIRQEPALSTYWDQRDQLEQALRQERRG